MYRPSRVFAKNNQASVLMDINSITGTGNPLQLPPNDVNDSLKFETGRPRLTTRARPRAIVIIPRVTIKGAILPNETTTPLAAPHITPVIIPIAKGITNGHSPGWAKQAATTPVSATRDPRLRSTPPVSKTNVTPTERMPFRDIWRATVIKLPYVRN